jgi:hypothetical protein
MEFMESDRIAANVACRFEDSTDTLQIASALVSIWEEIDGALRPVIGQRGVDGLFRRSLGGLLSLILR